MKFLTYLLASATALKLQESTGSLALMLLKEPPSQESLDILVNKPEDEFFAAACTCLTDQANMGASCNAWYGWMMQNCKGVTDGSC